MDFDLLFLVGLVFLPLAFVALVSAWADRRPPWAALILLAIGLGVAGWAYLSNPAGPYEWRAIPDLALRTLARYWRR